MLAMSDLLAENGNGECLLTPSTEYLVLSTQYPVLCTVPTLPALQGSLQIQAPTSINLRNPPTDPRPTP